jgi:hypothetical protein
MWFCGYNGMGCVYIERPGCDGVTGENRDRDMGKVMERLDDLSHAVENIQSIILSNSESILSASFQATFMAR